jgi:hypothetical protein
MEEIKAKVSVDWWRVAESGILILVLSVTFWAGAKAAQIGTLQNDISEIKSEHKILAKDLVETQKEMIKEITELRGDIKAIGRQ